MPISCFPSFSVPTFPLSPPPPFGLVVGIVGPFSLSFGSSASLLFAVDDRVTLRSLDIGVGRTAALAVFVRFTPLGPAFAVERNPGTFIGFVTGSLDGPGARSSTLPFPFS